MGCRDDDLALSALAFKIAAGAKPTQALLPRVFRYDCGDAVRSTGERQRSGSGPDGADARQPARGEIRDCAPATSHADQHEGRDTGTLPSVLIIPQAHGLPQSGSESLVAGWDLR